MKHYWKGIMLLAFVLAGCGGGNASPTAPANTVDPFVAIANAERTAQAAQDQAQIYSRQLTATAEAPIVAMTSTAAAWNMQQAYATGTAQAVQFAYTSTALAWTPTPAPTSTPNITATVAALEVSATAQSMINDVARDQLKTERDRATNQAWAVVPFLVLAIGIAAAIIFLYVAYRRLSFIAVPMNERGMPQAVFDVVEGTITDVDRMANATGSTRRVDLKALPQITAERQDGVVARDQQVDIVRASQRKLGQGQRTAALPAPSINEQLFPLPSWEIMQGWDGTGGLPYGVSARGLQRMDPSVHAHVATLGKTGTGKSRRFLRPFLAGALAAGHRVVILGKSADFHVFTNHPNATLVTVRDLTDEQEAARYAMMLKGIVGEMNRRDAYLTERNQSTWMHAGRENTFVVLDELGNALDLMPKAYADVARRHVIGLTKEGRKVGFNMVMATQRAKNMVDMFSQSSKAVFFVQDEQESRYAMGMPGAERLQDGYFYARFGSHQLIGAFEPSDDEIRAFLESRPVQELEPVRFVEQIEAEPEAERPFDDAQGRLPEPEKGLTAEQVNQIRAMQGRSISAIVTALWGYSGGDAGRKRADLVRKVIEGGAALTS